MRLRKGSLVYRVGSFCRWLAVRCFHRGAISADSVFHVGARNRIFIGKGAKLQLGRRVHLADDVELQCTGRLKIGSHTTINRHSRIVAFEDIQVGDNCAIAQFVSILDHDHRYVMSGGSMSLEGYVNEPVRIGSNVWIGEKVTVLKGVTVGNNVVIGAHSLVTRDIPDNCVAAGNPARVVRMLDE